MKKMTQTEFLALFSPECMQSIFACIKKWKATHVVCYECLDMCSSCLGDRKALCIGPNNTVKTLVDAEKTKLDMELCSTIKLPVAYMEC